MGSAKKCQRRFRTVVQDKDGAEITQRFDVVRIHAQRPSVFHQGFFEMAFAVKVHSFEIGFPCLSRNLLLQRFECNGIRSAGQVSRFIAIRVENHNRVLRRSRISLEIEVQLRRYIKRRRDLELVLVSCQPGNRELAVPEPLAGKQLRLLHHVFYGYCELRYHRSVRRDNHAFHRMRRVCKSPVYL